MINFVAGIILQVSLKMFETRLTLVLHGLHLYRKIPDAPVYFGDVRPAQCLHWCKCEERTHHLVSFHPMKHSLITYSRGLKRLNKLL